MRTAEAWAVHVLRQGRPMTLSMRNAPQLSERPNCRSAPLLERPLLERVPILKASMLERAEVRLRRTGVSQEVDGEFRKGLALADERGSSLRLVVGWTE